MTPGPSPLYAAVSLDWLPAVRLMPGDLVREVGAWIEHYGFDFPDADVEQLRRVVITDTELHLWTFPASAGRRESDRSWQTAGPHVIALRSHPSAAMLARLVAARVLACGATITDKDGAERWRCNVLTDDRGRHRGNHVDGRFGDEAEWPNSNPADAPPPAPPEAPVTVPSVARIRGVMAGALWLCHHDPAHPLSYTDPETCKTCQAIDRAAAAVHALIGAP